MRLPTLLRYARPRYALHSKRGRCTVCGRRTLFLVTDPATIRENAFCIWCRSMSRTRHLAKCVVEAFSQHGITCMRDLAEVPSVRICTMSAGGPLAAVWGERSHITYSEYIDGCPSGEYRDGVLCQDVEQLSFEGAVFDLVISEDVLEHVRDYRRGLGEIHRVLKPGGRHIFSTPVGFTHPTLSRFETSGGEAVPVLPVEEHGDPLRGRIPVMTSFGSDFLDILRDMGFDASLEISRHDEQRRYGTFDSYTFVTRKV
jgi:hypothetical protein